MADTGTPQRRVGLLGAAVTLTAASVATLLVNLVIQIQIADYFGVGAAMDAYKAAMTIPQWLQFVAGSAVTLVLVPFFVTAFKADESRGWKAASVAANGMLVTLAASVAVAAVAGRRLVGLVAPGLPPEQIALAGRLFRLTLPVGVLLLLQQVLVSLCHARFRFVRPAAATLLNGAAVIVCLAVLKRRMGIHVLPLALVVGTALASLIMLSLFVPRGRYRLTLSFRGTGLGRAALVALPVLIAIPVCQSETLAVTVAGSWYGEGVLSYLRYANVLWMALMQATASGLGAALFPFLSHAAAHADRQALKERFTKGVSAMLYITVPVAFIGLPLVQAMIEGLFQRGKFTADAVGPVAWLLILYLPAYIAWSLGTVTSSTIFSLRRTFEAGLLFVLAFAVFLAALGVLLPLASFYAIAIAGSIHAVARLGVSWWLLRRALGRLGSLSLLKSLGGILLSAAISAVAAYGLNVLLARVTGLVLLPAVLAGLVGLGMYGCLTLFVFRSPVSQIVRERLAPLLRRRKGAA